MNVKVTLSEFAAEIEAMLSVCFEGMIGREGEKIELQLVSGERFCLVCRKGD